MHKIFLNNKNFYKRKPIIFSKKSIYTSILWKHKRVTVLPHISANTDFNSASDIVAKNLKLFKLKKKIPKSVDLQRGY